MPGSRLASACVAALQSPVSPSYAPTWTTVTTTTTRACSITVISWLPLKWQSQILGVLCFYLAPGQELDDHRGNFLEAVGSIVATAVGRLNHQSQLAQSERLSSLGVLAAGVAHEIKNPLGLALTNAEWLVEDLPPILVNGRTLRERLIEEFGSERANTLMRDTPGLRNDELLQDMAQCTRDVLDGVRRVRTIVRELGTFSRADDEQPSPVSLADVLERAITLSHHETKYRARISRDFQEVPHVLAHEGRLTQVFLNLLINAAQAIEKGDPERNGSGSASGKTATRFSPRSKIREKASTPPTCPMCSSLFLQRRSAASARAWVCPFRTTSLPPWEGDSRRTARWAVVRASSSAFQWLSPWWREQGRLRRRPTRQQCRDSHFTFLSWREGRVSLDLCRSDIQHE